jgi:hypothetical protein
MDSFSHASGVGENCQRSDVSITPRRRDDAATNGQHLITDPECSARPLYGGPSACHEMHNEKNETDDEQNVE